MNTTVNLEKAVKTATEKKRESLSEGIDISEIKGLIEYGNRRDKEIINGLGMSSLVARIEENTGELLIMDKIQKANAMSVVHVDTIKDLCMDYRLRFLSSNSFVGVIVPEVINAVKALENNKSKEFEERTGKESNFNFDNHELKNKFFVLAPPKMFKLEKKAPEPRKIIDWDPILFYKEDDTHYILIKKWGKDFTIGRAILGAVTKNTSTLGLSLAFFFSCILLIASAFILPLTTLTTINIAIWLMSVIVISAFAASIFIPNDSSTYYTKNNWNGSFKS